MYLKLQPQGRYFNRLAAERLDSLYFKASCEILIAVRSFMSGEKNCPAPAHRGLFTKPAAVKRKLTVPVEEAVKAAKRIKV